MASGMLAGERRWASSRRGSKTVLGKVVVPKPLNLPSQRLENQGLDPNVEIVPKGTLSWGSGSSSPAPNAWGSSTLSPNADGGTSSPSHLSGRPSSGSGSRPSTACSDRTHEPPPSVWGQNSRPSSSSGALTSNQTVLTSLRPRSAETRPGSSQLSRFAESTSDISVAWSGVSEKLGVTSSKNDGFSLSSGDFPSLGLERENSGRSTESQDHGSYDRPGSSSSRVSGKEKNATSVGDISSANVKSGTLDTRRRDVDTWRRDDGVQPNVEKWQGDPPPYLNANIPPLHFDAWHGPPINPPPGVWYRGSPSGPPYAAPLAPGGFPIEPFPYRPQIPPAALANSQPVPPPGAGPRGHHPENGDMYRPYIPDTYIRPGIPIRPRYPGPVAYEGYYGPPRGYFNANERDIPFVGIAPGPSFYNRYSGENAPNHGNNHSRTSPHGSAGNTTVSEQAELSHPDDTRRPCNVLMKHHNEWGDSGAEDKWEHAAPAYSSCLERGDQPRTSSPKSEWGLEDGQEEETYLGTRILGRDAYSKNYDNRGRSFSDTVKVKSPENSGEAKAAVDSSVSKLENAASTFSQVPRVFQATPSDPTLIRRIEGLNAKARASDGWPDAPPIPSREEQKSRSQVVDVKGNPFMSKASTGSVCFERTSASGNLNQELDSSSVDETLQPIASRGASISRGAGYGMQGRLDQRGKRFIQDADGLQKKPPPAQSVSPVSTANSEPGSNEYTRDRLPAVDASEKYGIKLQGKDGEESSAPMFDPVDCQVQRAKMREIAKQRAIQLQKEEEERTREQKAKALAKLDELNRRIQAVGGSTLNSEKAPPCVSVGQEECQIPVEQLIVASKFVSPSLALVTNPNAQIRESSTPGVGKSSALSKDALLETADNVQLKPAVPRGQPLSLRQDALTAGAADCKAAPQVNEGSVSSHKRMGYKQKKGASLGKHLAEMSVPINPAGAPKDSADVAIQIVAPTVAGEVSPNCDSSLPMTSNNMDKPLAHQRKNNRSSKNKHKLEDASSATASPSAVPKETNGEKVSFESGKPKNSELGLDPRPILSNSVAEHAMQPSEEHTSLPSEEASGRVNNQSKSQHSRRMPRNQQGQRVAEKFNSGDAFIWAPIRPHNKDEVTEDGASNKTVSDIVTATTKSDYVLHSNLKSKRAEMERYVPKPVAKELAQQGSIQQSMQSSVNQTSSDTVLKAEPFQSIESSQPGNSTIGNIGCTIEPRNGKGKQNKQPQSHGSWRQRGSVESASVQGLPDGLSSTASPNKNLQKSTKHNPSLKPLVNSRKEQTNSSDDLNTTDGWNTPDIPDAAAPVTSAAVKDQGVTGRGKRHPVKGHRSMERNHGHDHRNVNSADTQKTSSRTPAADMGQTDRSLISEEDRGVGERTTPQWQPKSQVYSRQNQRGNQPSGGQTVHAGYAIERDTPSRDKVHLPPHHNKESREHFMQTPFDQPLREHKNMVQLPSLGHQESKREREAGSFRRPYSADESFNNMFEMVPPVSINAQNAQRLSSGFRKIENQDSHSGRWHESREHWGSAGQDNRWYTSSNRERRKHSSHYEYQPIGQHNDNNPSNNLEGPIDGSSDTGAGHRERSHCHSRHGGNSFHGRGNRAVSVDANYD